MTDSISKKAFSHGRLFVSDSTSSTVNLSVGNGLNKKLTHHDLWLDDDFNEEAEWSDEFDDDADENTPVESPVQHDLYVTPDSPETTENLYENIYQEAQEYDPGNSGQLYRAKALYDYQAADDTEITFDPDDIITEIEMLDEGWWRGYGPDGHYGLFPANYVEIISD
ncbi:hypothetical protein ILYODFUR_031294 [Ilyodon furcidens]|uniref:SH3 domain-containing protein n=1 Tax=Ilyodon furcidens TaxID=33524 RepID=A0ABV0UMC6_9TELE